MKTLLVTKKAIIDFDSIKEIRYGDNPQAFFRSLFNLKKTEQAQPKEGK